MTPRVAVIGAGYWGKNLVRVFHELGALHAVCDSDAKRLEALRAQTPGALLVNQWEQVLRDPAVAAVVIATPAESHARLAQAAFQAGKDVFVEKPLALTLADGQAVCAQAAAARRVLMVGHLLEYHPAVTALKTLVDEGALGKLQYLYSNRLNFGKIRTEENILWSFAPHDISAIQLLLNERPAAVSSHGASYLHEAVADVTVTTLRFASGVHAHIFVSWLHPYKEQRLVVIGDKQMAVFNDTAEKDKLVLYPHAVDWINRVPVPRKREGHAVAFDAAEPLRVECRHFLDCVATRSTPKTDGQNGLRVLEILTACQTSLEQEGRPVALAAQKGR